MLGNGTLRGLGRWRLHSWWYAEVVRGPPLTCHPRLHLATHLPMHAGQHRWVEYAGDKTFYEVDASAVPAEWHGWLHSSTAEPPTDVSERTARRQGHKPPGPRAGCSHGPQLLPGLAAGGAIRVPAARDC
jgi:hypothetical protein